MADPDTAAKNMQPTTATIASPEVMCPTSASANATSRRVMPPTDMMSPARMKSGTATSGKVSTAVHNFWTTTRSGRPVRNRPTSAAIPRLNEMGDPHQEEQEEERDEPDHQRLVLRRNSSMAPRIR